MAKDQRVFTGTGRRKSSVARVRLVPGSGKITVNGRDVNEYMPFEVLVMDLKQPLELTNNLETFDIDCNVSGGGFSGQTSSALHNSMKMQLAAYRKLLNIEAKIDIDAAAILIVNKNGIVEHDKY